MAEKLYVNGVPLQSESVTIETLDGLWNSPKIRGSDYNVPGRHGVVRNPLRIYDSAQITIPLFVTGINPTNGVAFPDEHVDQLRANVKALVKLFSAETLVITHEYPNGSAVQAIGRLAYDPMTFERNTSFPESTKIAFVVDIPGAFWTDVNITSQTVSATSSETVPILWTSFQDADAPMDELEISFHGPCSNPRIQQGGMWLQWNDIIPGGQIIKFNPDMSFYGQTNVDDDVFQLDYSRISHFGSARWFELHPDSPPRTLFTHTGGGSASVTLTGRKKYLIG